MKFNKYQKLAVRTKPEEYLRQRELQHAAYGLATETGEFIDPVKKHQFYGKPLDTENLIEELGDILWYAALACDSLQISMEDVAIRNIEKLTKRYPDKFTQEAAILRADKQGSEEL